MGKKTWRTRKGSSKYRQKRKMRKAAGGSIRKVIKKEILRHAEIKKAFTGGVGGNNVFDPVIVGAALTAVQQLIPEVVEGDAQQSRLAKRITVMKFRCKVKVAFQYPNATVSSATDVGSLYIHLCIPTAGQIGVGGANAVNNVQVVAGYDFDQLQGNWCVHKPLFDEQFLKFRVVKTWKYSPTIRPNGTVGVNLQLNSGRDSLDHEFEIGQKLAFQTKKGDKTILRYIGDLDVIPSNQCPILLFVNASLLNSTYIANSCMTFKDVQ